MLLALQSAAGPIPIHPLAGGGSMPMMAMGGNDFAGWFQAAGKGAAIQTFYSYGNGRHIAPQLQAAGRENVFVQTGIPCGCCGSDSPKVKPMNKSLAEAYIDDELSQLNTSYADLLLFHHRCDTEAETAAVWTALEAAKRAGMARHIGVSNFNTHDLAALMATVEEPIEVLEAHFGVGVMDFEVLAYANAHNIHPVSFSSLSESSTDLATLHPVVASVATAHNASSAQIMHAMTIEPPQPRCVASLHRVRDAAGTRTSPRATSRCSRPSTPSGCRRTSIFDVTLPSLLTSSYHRLPSNIILHVPGGPLDL